MNTEIETVARCMACGGDVPDPQETQVHECPRGGGAVVRVHPLACAVEGCKLAANNATLPSTTHFADHMHWHQQQWKNEPVARSAAPWSTSEKADRWNFACLEIAPGASLPATLLPPKPGCVCREVLFFSSNELLHRLIANCPPVGHAPLGAYPTNDRTAVVTLDKSEHVDSYEVEIYNDGGSTAIVRVGATWEL